MPHPLQGGTRAIWILALCTTALPARAGMPSLTVSDLAGARLQTLSFFLLLFLLSALAVKGLWNYLRRDFPRLPRLTYPRACAVVGLWGLLFVLVLTMISGARELLTPGAWEKSGLTYKLKPGPETDQTRALWDAVNANRQTRLLELKLALWSYAATHNGQLPLDDQTADIPPAAWETPDPSRIRYVYLPGRTVAPSATPDALIVAHEPPVFPAPRLALTADGQIREFSPADLRAAVERPTWNAATQPAGGETR